jgi:pyruvate/2-oxoglutarate/acetoin dehydrogenase E1 component
MSSDKRVYVIGEDILDPYGGAFKVTRGLSTSFPDRVMTTPISEAGIVGVATGMALRGLFPVVEIMFGDFFTLIADQLINHAAKFRWMYNNQVHVPIVIRSPMGGRRGYGPTHSQSLEKLYLGVPGLRILAPCFLGDPGEILVRAIFDDNDPVLFIENKLLYLNEIRDIHSLDEFKITSTTPGIAGESFLPAVTYAPTYVLSLRDAPPPTLTLVAYGYMTGLAIQAATNLAYEHEIFTELVIPTQLAPYIMTPILESAKITRQLLVVEEGNLTLGWGAEIVARTTEALDSGLKNARRVGGRDLPIPASGPMEDYVLPNVEDIIHTALKFER